MYFHFPIKQCVCFELFSFVCFLPAFLLFFFLFFLFLRRVHIGDMVFLQNPLQLAYSFQTRRFSILLPLLLQNFLNQYHYLSTSRSGNHDVESAIRHFQRFAGIKVTGRLDSATIRQMKKPRCGMPDDAAGSDRVRRYKTGSNWRKTSLTYYIQFGQDLPQGTQERIFQKALQYWADVSALSFTRTNFPEKADLKIRYIAI